MAHRLGRVLAGGLVSLVMAALLAGCGGPSPETRATLTAVAVRGTATLQPLPLAKTAVAGGTPMRIATEIVVEMTAEASLPVATPSPMADSTNSVWTELRRES